MSYIDAFHDRKNDKIKVAERQNGKRTIKEMPAEYVFYYEHASGTNRSIFGHPVKRFHSTSNHKFRGTLSDYLDKGCRVFESDINPVFRFLASNYAGIEAPTLNLGFFDIESDFHPDKGFAPPTDPFNAITAITLYRSADQKLLTYVLKPPTISYAEAQAIVDQCEDTWLYDDEGELLSAFLDAIEDVDVLTSWNGSYYDIPYTINRVARVLNKEATKRFCLFDQFPSEREYKNKFGKTVKTYDLVGRVHLDYLELYAKHNPQQKLSYALNAIGQLVVGESKVVYDGSLDDLYKKEFGKFIDYNRQDVLLMVKIDQKLKYIELHNQVAHSNSVILKTTMGSVALVEQAIINEMHKMGFVAPNRRSKDEQEEIDIDDVDIDDDDDAEDFFKAIVEDGRTPVVGAYVAQPKKGLHDQVGCVDINSLYPSAIRSLNMSPETLVGQVRMDETMKLVHERAAKLSKTKRAEAWDGIFATLEVSHMHDKDDAVLTVDFFDLMNDTVRTEKMTGSQLNDYIFDPANHVCITANGTIFKTDVDGIIPMLLATWYSERQEMQAREADWNDLSYGFLISEEQVKCLEQVKKSDNSSIISLDLQDKPASEIKHALSIDDFETVIRLCRKNGVGLVCGETGDGECSFHLMYAGPDAQIRFIKDYWNQRQQSRKILLNSLYGALLNIALRFYDERLGQSVTLTGRTIVRHMNAKINELIAGQYDYKGDAIVYADTDSCYFSAHTYARSFTEEEQAKILAGYGIDRPFGLDPNEMAMIMASREDTIDFYDLIAEATNETFSEFMHRTFNTTLERGGIIRAGRELVGSRTLFIKKKKYAVLQYEKEGKRLDKDGKLGKLKVMGLDLKRADTPNYMQEFLEKLLLDVLSGRDKALMYADIKAFRKLFKDRPGWEKGSPKKVADLTGYQAKLEYANKALSLGGRNQQVVRRDDSLKVRIPGHVLASMNWNKLCGVFNDKHAVPIQDGTRIIVCKLMKNSLGMTSVAYPIDEPHLPPWFKELPFDHSAMEETVIDNKINNLVGVLEWDLTDTKEKAADDLFTWG